MQAVTKTDMIHPVQTSAISSDRLNCILDMNSNKPFHIKHQHKRNDLEASRTENQASAEYIHIKR